MKKLLLIGFSFILLIMGCAPITFSNLQSAKLIDKGKFEYTPSFSSSVNTINYGLQTAYGLSEKYNLRLRLERIVIGVDDSDDNSSGSLNFSDFNVSFSHLSFGLKYPLVADKSAMYLPISFTKPDNTNNVLILIEPTLLHTESYSEKTEFNSSIKALIPISESINDNGILLALNLGLGMSPDLTKWVIRPEMGLITTIAFDGFIPQLSIGLSIYP